MEQIMQYVWRFRLWPGTAIPATDGRRVEVLDPGRLNTGSGPDFFNAVISIDGQQWAGNVELHVRASDWYRHSHDGDHAYDSVILHVVLVDDAAVTTPGGGKVITQVVMPGIDNFMEGYRAMAEAPGDGLPCAPLLPAVPALVMNDWLTALATERLQRKADDVHRLLKMYSGDWNAVGYVLLARSLGFGTNADQMERLARAVPLGALMRHRQQGSAVEAMLLGRSGLLHDPARDDYEDALLRDYAFYRHKFGIPDGEAIVWNLRTRPANSPLRRIVLLAAIIGAHPQAGAEIIHTATRNATPVCGDGYDGYFGEETPRRSGLQAEDIQHIVSILDAPMPLYWQEHLSPGSGTRCPMKPLGKQAMQSLLINFATPMIYTYAETLNSPETLQAATDLLMSLQPEDNSAVRTFTGAGVRCSDAFTSQALIQLRSAYCQPRKCLWCRIGHRLLSDRARRPAPPLRP